MMGVSVAALVKAAVARGAAFVGANCGLGVEQYLGIAEAFGRDCPLPVWIKPNAGKPDLVEGQATYRTGAAQFASYAPRFFAAGVRMLGGCCGTSPEYIREIRANG
jgi:methionine synthase I (cobalamin-dependent)